MDIKRHYLLIKEKIKHSLDFLYNILKINELWFFFLFLFHRYSPQQFQPIFVPQNLRILYRVRFSDRITTTRQGKLLLLTSPWQKWLFSTKNILLLGALQKRVERVVFYTYLTLTLELNNPFDKRVLEFFLKHKLQFLERLLDYVKKINGKWWDQSELRLHLKAFERNSLFQAEVIRTMHLATKRQKPQELVLEAKEALKRGLYPVLVVVGVSGSYWMRGVDRRIIGLFKPFDEEIHAPNNPVGPKFRGTLGLRKTRQGCRVGESPHHEVGAFLVDEFLGFGIVPKTYYAEFEHHIFFLSRENRLSFRRVVKKKYGSFQEYVSGFVSLDKLTPEERTSIPLEEFQLLIVLDVILGNTDRNIGNILIGEEKLAAIDHGLCFTDRIDDFSYWYWAYFPQGREPLYQPIVHLLNHFPFEELSLKLRKKCFISLVALQRMRERVVLFTEAINAGLVPAEIIDLFTIDYLYPLKDRNTTLKDVAIQQVKLYQEHLKQDI